jgi:hypothetical protein
MVNILLHEYLSKSTPRRPPHVATSSLPLVSSSAKAPKTDDAFQSFDDFGDFSSEAFTRGEETLPGRWAFIPTAEELAVLEGLSFSLPYPTAITTNLPRTMSSSSSAASSSDATVYKWGGSYLCGINLCCEQTRKMKGGGRLKLEDDDDDDENTSIGSCSTDANSSFGDDEADESSVELALR